MWHLTNLERWPRGLRRTLGKRVYGNVPWVRIPPSPQTTIIILVSRLHDHGLCKQASRTVGGISFST